MKLEGTIVAMVTPFNDEDVVDETGIRENINYLIDREWKVYWQREQQVNPLP